ncbi:MAG: L,D-transpeptidase family protein [bacterium]
MSKSKQLDGINNSESQIVTGQAQYQEPLQNAEELISVKQPNGAAPKNIVMPKKPHFLFRKVFQKKSKATLEQAKKRIVADAQEKSAKKLKEPIVKTSNAAKDKQSIEDITSKDSLFRSHKKIFVPLFIVVAILLLTTGAVVGAAYAHQTIYENKFFPGVIVWGENVGGKTTNEAQLIINKKIDSYKVVIGGPDQDYSASASDLGILFDSEKMVFSAFNTGRKESWFNNYLVRARLFISSLGWDQTTKLVDSASLVVKPVYIVEDTKLTEYLTKISDNIKIDPQDSQITVTGATTQLKPAIYGRKVDFDSLKNSVKSSIGLLKTDKITVQTTKIQPAIVDNSAQEVMVQAESVMQRPVILNYQGLDYRPSQETVASWIAFAKNPGEIKYTIVLDQSKMTNYFSFLKNKIDIEPIGRNVRVENGVKSTETQAGKDGLRVDTALLGKQIAEALPVQPDVALAIPTYVETFQTKYENVVVADWDKYVDINLSTQTMLACERGGINCREWRVMTGKNSTPTPVGTFLVLGRTANFWMTGLEGTPEAYRLWVPYATWFKGGGYAIHSASWRNNNPESSNGFGNQSYTWNGSHGCVNSPDDAAAFIYNWAPVGTPVTVHN